MVDFIKLKKKHNNNNGKKGKEKNHKQKGGECQTRQTQKKINRRRVAIKLI